MSEVRACPKCGAAAVTLASAWKHTYFGAETSNVTRDYRCQACGAKFTIHDRASVRGLWIAGALTALAVVGIPMLVLAWWRGSMERRLRIVAGAPTPPIRFRDGPPIRTCGVCNGNAVAKSIVRNRINGVPSGTETKYACEGCKTEFFVDSPLTYVWLVAGVSLMGLFAYLFVTQSSSLGWRWGGSGVCTAIVLVLVGQGARRLMNRVTNPPQHDDMTVRN